MERLEESELDNYTSIAELIGIEFDENTVWGQLDIGELKLLIYAALGRHGEAREYVRNFMTYNDNTTERRLFYQALDAALHIHLEDGLHLEDYRTNLTRMFGEATMAAVCGTLSGGVRFHGLTETGMTLDGLDKHRRLIESYDKLHRARAREAGLTGES